MQSGWKTKSRHVVGFVPRRTSPRWIAKKSGCCQRHPVLLGQQQRQEEARRRFTTQKPHEATSTTPRTSTNITVTAGGAAALVVGGALAARWLYGHFVQSNLEPYSPQRDTSRATVLIQTAPPPPKVVEQAKLGSKNAGPSDATTTTALQQVDAAAFEQFVAQQRAMLRQEAQHVQREAAQVLHQELQHAIADADQRIAAFCDWYLSYSTTYKFLGIATKSALAHVVTFSKEQTLATRVTQDVQEHLGRKYQALVLRPAWTDPRIHRAMVRALQTAHCGYKEALQKLESSLADFVSQQAHPYYGKPPAAHDVVVHMDWVAQLQKVDHLPVVYEKTPTVAIVAFAAATGKLASSGVGVATAKALSAKLAAPFASKAATTALASKAAAGATGGAVLGGPVGGAVGAVAGAAVGIGLDMTVNAGISLMQRPALEQDVRDALQATLLEWEERLAPELERVHEAWFDHAAAVLQPKDSVQFKPTDSRPSLKPTVSSPLQEQDGDTQVVQEGTDTQQSNTTNDSNHTKQDEKAN